MTFQEEWEMTFSPPVKKGTAKRERGLAIEGYVFV